MLSVERVLRLSLSRCHNLVEVVEQSTERRNHRPKFCGTSETGRGTVARDFEYLVRSQNTSDLSPVETYHAGHSAEDAYGVYLAVAREFVDYCQGRDEGWWPLKNHELIEERLEAEASLRFIERNRETIIKDGHSFLRSDGMIVVRIFSRPLPN